MLIAQLSGGCCGHPVSSTRETSRRLPCTRMITELKSAGIRSRSAIQRTGNYGTVVRERSRFAPRFGSAPEHVWPSLTISKLSSVSNGRLKVEADDVALDHDKKDWRKDGPLVNWNCQANTLTLSQRAESCLRSPSQDTFRSCLGTGRDFHMERASSETELRETKLERDTEKSESCQRKLIVTFGRNSGYSGSLR